MGHNYTLDKTVIKCTQNFMGKCLEKQPLGRTRKGLDNSKIGLRQAGYENNSPQLCPLVGFDITSAEFSGSGQMAS